MDLTSLKLHVADKLNLASQYDLSYIELFVNGHSIHSIIRGLAIAKHCDDDYGTYAMIQRRSNMLNARYDSLTPLYAAFTACHNWPIARSFLAHKLNSNLVLAQSNKMRFKTKLAAALYNHRIKSVRKFHDTIDRYKALTSKSSLGPESISHILGVTFGIHKNVDPKSNGASLMNTMIAPALNALSQLSYYDVQQPIFKVHESMYLACNESAFAENFNLAAYFRFNRFADYIWRSHLSAAKRLACNSIEDYLVDTLADNYVISDMPVYRPYNG